MSNNKVIDELLSLVIPVDIETTGTDIDTAEICELGAAIAANGTLAPLSVLFGTSSPIPFNASAVNNISRKMLAGLPVFDDRLDSVANILNITNQKYIVVHNHRFDGKVLDKYKSANPDYLKNKNGDDLKYICTYRLAKHLFNGTEMNGNIDSFGLNYLRYYFDLDESSYYPEDLGDTAPHRAGHDALICGLLFIHMANYAMDNLGLAVESGEQLADILHELCHTPIEIKNMPFGKHKGEPLSEVPLSYLSWAIDNTDFLNESHTNYDEDLATSILKAVDERV